MRRNARFIKEEKSISDKIILYSGIGVAILTLIVIGLLMYSKSLSDDVKNSTLSLGEMASIANKTNESNVITESASTQMGKTVEESKDDFGDGGKNHVDDQNQTNETNKINITEKKLNVNKTENSTQNATQNTAETAVAEEKVEQKELIFQKPVDGEIVREYAKDNLIFSETLQEWTTHMGIDIKADKTTVVKAAEGGVIKSIKNDPRYGLTIVIEHDEHFQTVYSNLLTSEFVVEGETVEKGQSIGTVGNTAVFEIADEPHLHFEILKDNLPEDPSIYLK